mmetsp:Transcript_23979/g.41795  ORF Transcript_23979/g.41795 Transcript_23979/m.41795 type:complete len:230 (-) Transcript_23979:1012-1701(-)
MPPSLRLLRASFFPATAWAATNSAAAEAAAAAYYEELSSRGALAFWARAVFFFLRVLLATEVAAAIKRFTTSPFITIEHSMLPKIGPHKVIPGLLLPITKGAPNSPWVISCPSSTTHRKAISLLHVHCVYLVLFIESAVQHSINGSFGVESQPIQALSLKLPVAYGFFINTQDLLLFIDMANKLELPRAARLQLWALVVDGADEHIQGSVVLCDCIDSMELALCTCCCP